jgi:hypothetical protein
VLPDDAPPDEDTWKGGTWGSGKGGVRGLGDGKTRWRISYYLDGHAPHGSECIPKADSILLDGSLLFLYRVGVRTS